MARASARAWVLGSGSLGEEHRAHRTPYHRPRRYLPLSHSPLNAESVEMSPMQRASGEPSTRTSQEPCCYQWQRCACASPNLRVSTLMAYVPSFKPVSAPCPPSQASRHSADRKSRVRSCVQAGVPDRLNPLRGGLRNVRTPSDESIGESGSRQKDPGRRRSTVAF